VLLAPPGTYEIVIEERGYPPAAERDPFRTGQRRLHRQNHDSQSV